MHINPDENREWYVFYEEKEFGPLREKGLKSKFVNGDFDDSAYVYTEGMQDWEKIGDIEVFNLTQSADHFSISDADSLSDATPMTPVLDYDELLQEKESHKKEVTLKSDSEKVSQNFGPQTYVRQRKADVDLPEEPEVLLPDSQEVSHFDDEEFTVGDGVETEKLGATANEHEPELDTALPKKKSFSDKFKKPITWALIVFALFAGLYFLVEKFWKGIETKKVEKVIPKKNAAKGSKKTSTAEKSVAVANTNVPLVAGSVVTERDWDNFSKIHLSQQGGVSQKFDYKVVDLGGRFFVVGVVSRKLLKDFGGQIVAMVYPNLNKNVFNSIHHWRQRFSESKGYFVLGPIAQSGKKISSGYYFLDVRLIKVGGFAGDYQKLMALPRQEIYLGQQNVVVDSAQNKAKIIESEKYYFNQYLSQVKLAVDDLNNMAKVLSDKSGVKDLNAWKLNYERWVSDKLKPLYNLNSTQNSRGIYYPHVNKKYYQYTVDLGKYAEAYDLIAKKTKGPNKLLKADVIVGLKTVVDKLQGEINVFSVNDAQKNIYSNERLKELFKGE